MSEGEEERSVNMLLEKFAPKKNAAVVVPIIPTKK